MTAELWPRLLPLGDGAVTLQFGPALTDAVHAQVMGFVQVLAAAQAQGQLQGVTEWVPAFASVTVHLADAASEAAAEQRDTQLLALARSAPAVQTAGRRWLLPACFDEDLAPDLAALAATKGLTVPQVIEHVTATPLRVYMLGFLPGFPYMGNLPAAVEVPRLASPRKEVPERSVAVAGRLCAVYPWASPGGWHLIGRTPVRVFDTAQPEPALLRAGDELRWQPVNRDHFEALEARAASGQLNPQQWLQAVV